MCPTDGWPVGVHPPKIFVRLRKALYGFKQAPRRWPGNINACLLPCGFAWSSADPNLDLNNDGIQIILYIDDISMSHLVAAGKAVIKITVELAEKYLMLTLGSAYIYYVISISFEDIVTRISFGQNAYSTSTLRQFSMPHSPVS